MSDETAVDYAHARCRFRLAPAQLGHVFCSPAETGCADGEVGTFVFAEGSEESLDSRVGNGWSAVVKERGEEAHEVQKVSDFVELVPEAGGGHGVVADHDV